MHLQKTVLNLNKILVCSVENRLLTGYSIHNNIIHSRINFNQGVCLSSCPTAIDDCNKPEIRKINSSPYIPLDNSLYVEPALVRVTQVHTDVLKFNLWRQHKRPLPELAGTFSKNKDIRSFSTLTNRTKNDSLALSRSESSKPPDLTKLSRKQKLQRVVKDYGKTVIVFHVGISLVSLGSCYLLVTSGLDLQKYLVPLGVNGLVSNAGTFVTAYAIHKVFAPVRLSITLAATPFIVNYLRKIGVLKANQG